MNTTFSDQRRWSSGFTLVELLVTIVIVAMLTAIAVPGYRNHVVKTKRAAAAGCLVQFAAAMERYYTTQVSYDFEGITTGDTDPVRPPCATEGNMDLAYTFPMPSKTASPATLSATGYVLKAVPTSTTAARDKVCHTLTLDQRGTKDIEVRGTPTTCW